MSKILVVGATGQLGMAATKKLLAKGRTVRVLARRPEQTARFRELGAEAVLGDLTDFPSLVAACGGVREIVATANAAVPSRKGDTFRVVEGEGYANLIRAASQAAVQRFVYTSVPLSKYGHLSGFFRYKRETERRLVESSMEHVIFRADIFMDVAFSMIGSDIPLRGSEAATVLRPFQFARGHFERIKDNIERKRVAMVPGDGRARHAFICIDDVASFLVAAVSCGSSGIYDLGGPEALSFVDIVRLYEKILGIDIRIKHTPAVVFRGMASLLKPFSPAAANLMFLNYIGAIEETTPDSVKTAALFETQLTSAESFLRRKQGIASRAGV